MEVFRGIHELDRSLGPVVVTVGNFDGVHLGHAQILRTAAEQARARGGTLVVYTFKPHPRQVLRPDPPVPLLTTYAERLELLGKAGAQVVIEEPFSRDFSNTPAERFFSENLVHRLSAEAVVVGYDFSFGRGREGSLKSLEDLSRSSGVTLTVAPPHRVGDEVASSSGVRRHLLDGDLEAAKALLGYEFFYRGVVVRGEQRGRKLGFPTANVRIGEKLVLPYGVYATWAVVDGKPFASVTNLGVRPTFESTEPEPLVECHLLDQDVDLYGRTLEVRFVKRLREERRFPGVDALKDQIGRDAAEARRTLT
ncbi:MAG TPA: bifunctional riboflavin kinase/FAD synthetase [Bdellovibrionota bacterium]|nr:bifunctional riboflavin kinase/FAD synthetase [Bdellovibrionota bacterium]